MRTPPHSIAIPCVTVVGMWSLNSLQSNTVRSSTLRTPQPQENTGLQWLDLSHNALGESGAAVLGEALAKRDEELKLILEDPTVDGQAAQTLKATLGENPRHELVMPPASHRKEHRMPAGGMPAKGSIARHQTKMEL